MEKRFVSVWFKYLLADWMVRKMPDLKTCPFVFFTMDHGKQVIVSMNKPASDAGISIGMTIPDARTLVADLEPFEFKEEILDKLLHALAEWAGRYSPSVSIDKPDGLIIDASACAHLWGGEKPYVNDVVRRLDKMGFQVRAAMAESVGLAWAVARFGKDKPIIPTGQAEVAIRSLPAEALRLDDETVSKLKKLGIRRVGDLLQIPKASLNRRFGEIISKRLYQALGMLPEPIKPVGYRKPYTERLNLFEPVASVENIERALSSLISKLCERLKSEGLGATSLEFSCHRIDGVIERVAIGTSAPSRNAPVLLKLFSNKIERIEPALGIELFILTAMKVEPYDLKQGEIIEGDSNYESVMGLIDKILNQFDGKGVFTYSPRSSHWPENSVRIEGPVSEVSVWDENKVRPISVLKRPERIEVTAPVPDYPPMLFRHRGALYRVRKADGPERIEREWWLEKGEPRDYYQLEDEKGRRFWVFRSGHYQEGKPADWFLHGFFG